MAHINVDTLPPVKIFSIGGFVERAEELIDKSAKALELYGRLSNADSHRQVG
jgi:hypothetical protein